VSYVTTGTSVVFTWHLSGATGINDFEIDPAVNPGWGIPQQFFGPPSGWTETFHGLPGEVFHACAGSGGVCNGAAQMQDGDQFTIILNQPYAGCTLVVGVTQNGASLGTTVAARPSCPP
jgi:hypothetical protein